MMAGSDETQPHVSIESLLDEIPLPDVLAWGTFLYVTVMMLILPFPLVECCIKRDMKVYLVREFI